MSIINDALKKTQLNFKKKNKPAEKQEEPQAAQADQSTSNVYEKLYQKQQDLQSASSAARRQQANTSDKSSTLRSAKKWIKISTTTAVCLLFLAGGLYFLSRFEPVQDFFRSIKRKTAPSRNYIARQAQKRRSYKPGELVLNGTSLIDGKRVALINDEIYQVGETINGKKITSINMNQIELRDDEKIITLRVH